MLLLLIVVAASFRFGYYKKKQVNKDLEASRQYQCKGK